MPISPTSSAAARNFSRAAASYRRWALPQREAAARLAALLPSDCQPRRAVDVGCGTGFLVEALLRERPGLSIHGVDIAPGMVEQCRAHFAGRNGLTFSVENGSVYTPAAGTDLVASSFALQWMPPVKETLGRWLSIPGGGMLAVAVPVKGSLEHLETAHIQAIGRPMGGLDFPTEDAIVAAVEAHGGRIRAQEFDRLGFSTANGMEALRALRAIGAGTRGHEGYLPLSAGEIRRLADVYTSLWSQGDGTVPVVYHVVHIIAEVSR